MSLEKNKILKFNQHMKSDKMLYIIYADLESLIKKIDGCVNNPEKIFNNKKWRAYPLWIFNLNNLEI